MLLTPCVIKLALANPVVKLAQIPFSAVGVLRHRGLVTAVGVSPY